MTDVLEEVSTFRARSNPPDLDDLRRRAAPPGPTIARPRRSAVAVLVAAAVLVIVAAGVVLVDRAADVPAATTTTASVSEPDPATSAPRMGLARRYAVTATPSTPITIGISTPGPDVPRLGWEGGGSTDLELTNVTDVPVVVTPPDWDAEGGGVIRSFPCPTEQMCQPHQAGADFVVAPGERFLLPIWFEPPEVGTWDLTFRFGWRMDGGSGATGSDTFRMHVEATEAPHVDDHPELTTTMPR